MTRPGIAAAMRCCMLACLLAAGPAGAGAAPGAPVDEAALEARVKHLGAELRCLVCQNQTIADSNSGLAIDLKKQIREQLRAGRTESEVLAYLVERYGDFVLYRPPVKVTTAALWYGPFALLALGAAAAVLVVRRRRPGADGVVLSDTQRERAAALLADQPEIVA